MAHNEVPVVPLRNDGDGGDVDAALFLARQSLAATGGKSNLRATQWLLDRRAQEYSPHYPAPDMASELGQEDDEAEDQERVDRREDDDDDDDDDGEEEVEEEDEEEVGAGSFVPPSVAAGETLRFSSQKRMAHAMPGHSLPFQFLSHRMDHQLGSLQRHPSTGSCSSSVALQGDEPFGAQLQLKLPPGAEEAPCAHFPRIVDRKISASSPEPRWNVDAPVQPTIALPFSHETVKMPQNVLQTAPLSASPSATAALQDVKGHRKRKWQDEPHASDAKSLAPTASLVERDLLQQCPPSQFDHQLGSLAERMQPRAISEILGQDHLVGPNCVLRSLLDAPSLPCIIFSGPPGTGKTALTRLIARSASCRFVAPRCAKPGDIDIEKILVEAKQARKFGQRTVLFVESISGFSKCEQERVLPAIERGYLVFMGGTTRDPSSELISRLLLRCRLFTLKKLHPVHLQKVLHQAIADHERGIMVMVRDAFGIDALTVEDEAIQFIATEADGNARAALNALEAAAYTAVTRVSQKWKTETDAGKLAGMETLCEKRIGNTGLRKQDATHQVLEHLKGYFEFSQEEYARPFKKIVGGKEVAYGTPNRDKGRPHASSDVDPSEAKATVVVTITNAMEAFQWPQPVLESFQDDDDSAADLLSALLISIRGSESNAAVYWLARLLEKSKEPLQVATSLTKFACDEVGIADPQALVQATACYQACRVLRPSDCTSHLTQCVVYLCMAPKSSALSLGYNAAQRVVREGGNEPVPSHLRSEHRHFPKELGYLPPSLRNFKFFRGLHQ